MKTKTIITAIIILISFSLFAQKQKKVKIDFVPEYLKQAKSIEIKIISETKEEYNARKKRKKNNKFYQPLYLSNSYINGLKSYLKKSIIIDKAKDNSKKKLDLLFTVTATDADSKVKETQGSYKIYNSNGGYREYNSTGLKKIEVHCEYRVSIIDKATKEKLLYTSFMVIAKNKSNLLSETFKKFQVKGLTSQKLFVKINSEDIIDKKYILTKETFQKLIDEGQDLNYTCKEDRYSKWPLLMRLYPRTDLMKVLLKNGASSKGYNNKKETVLHLRDAINDTELLELILKNGIDIKEIVKRENIGKQNITTKSLLYNAAGNWNYRLLKLLFENGANLNVSYIRRADAIYGTPLFEVILASNNLKMIEFFIKNSDVDINKYIYYNKINFPPIYSPFKNRNYNIMKFMIKYGANLNVGYYTYAKGKIDGYSLLALAAKNADLKMMRFLIKNGASVNFHYKEKTALDVYKKDNKKIKMYLDSLGAIKYEEFNRTYDQKEYDKIIKYMISGFPINSIQFAKIKSYLKTKIKEYPELREIIKLKENNFNDINLYALIRKGNLDSLKKIVNLVGNNILKTQGLLTEAVYKKKINIASYLIKNGADVNEKWDINSQPIFYAKSEKMISLLMKNGADISSKDNSGRNVFERALFHYKKFYLAEALIENGMNPNKMAEDKYSPVELVCKTVKYKNETKTLSLLKQLFKAGASTENLENGLYKVILPFGYSFKTAKYLIDKGADPFKNTKFKNTCYNLAKSKKHKELVKYMKSKR